MKVHFFNFLTHRALRSKVHPDDFLKKQSAGKNNAGIFGNRPEHFGLLWEAAPVETAILNRLSYMLGCDVLFTGKIGNSPGDF